MIENLDYRGTDNRESTVLLCCFLFYGKLVYTGLLNKSHVTMPTSEFFAVAWWT